MRFKSIDLIKYGHFTDQSFKFPLENQDFHILLGSNEAGKSTTLSALEDFLFGILNNSKYNFIHDYKKMRIGADLENEKTSLYAIRRKGSKNTLLNSDDFQIDGGEAALDPFLQQAKRPFFERMFSLDRIRLEKGGQEILDSKDEVGQIFFSAATGILGFRDKLSEMLREADNLWSPNKAKHRKYYELKSKLDEADSELKEQTTTINQWLELKKLFEETDSNFTEFQSEYGEKTAEAKRLSRIRRVYRYVIEKNKLEDKIEKLGSVISLPKDAKELVENAEKDQNITSARVDTIVKKMNQIQDDINNIQFDENLLLRKDDIISINDFRARIRGEKDDLPKRQAELENLQERLNNLAEELKWTNENIIEQIPASSKISLARSLITNRGQIESNLSNRRETLKDTQDKLLDIEKSIKNIGFIADVSRLKSVIKNIQSKGDINLKKQAFEHEIKESKVRIDSLLKRINPAITDEKSAMHMRVPSTGDVNNHRDLFLDWNRSKNEKEQNVKKMEEELSRDRIKYEQAIKGENRITETQLIEAKKYRDALWKLVKKKHLENSPLTNEDISLYQKELKDLASAFELAIQGVDTISKNRFDNAEKAGQLAQMSRSIEEKEKELKLHSSQLPDLVEKGNELNKEWLNLWNNSNIEPLTPDTMLKWLETYNDLIVVYESCDIASNNLNQSNSDELELKKSLIKELDLIDIDTSVFKNDSFYMILENVKAVVDENESKGKRRNDLQNDSLIVIKEIEQRQRDLENAEGEWLEWKNEWSEITTNLNLLHDLKYEEVNTNIEQIEEMRVLASQINDIREKRIKTIQRDISDFESKVKELVQRVASDLLKTEPEEAVLEIVKRLWKSQKNNDLRETKINDLQELEKEKEELEKKYIEEEERVIHLKQLINKDSIVELKTAIAKSDELRELNSRIAKINQTLDEESDGLSFDQLKKDCEEIEFDKITGQEDIIGAELKLLREKLDSALIDRSDAEKAYKAIGGDDSAAKVEAKRQEALSEMQEVVTDYIKVRTSTILLQWAIDNFLRKKQAPLLKNAGILFSKITGKSFIDLSIDYDNSDKPYLIAIRSNQEVVTAEGLSTGTRDQLFFVLRIAFIMDYLEKAPALPFVADDIFVNFDDDRAAAGFRILADLAEKTQVLFFTHHKHLVDIAKEELGSELSIISLNN